MDVFSKKFVAMFSDKDKEDEAVKFYKEHIDSIPAEIQVIKYFCFFFNFFLNYVLILLKLID